MGVSRDCPIFWGYPLLSQQRVKLRTSNFVGTFIGSTGTKSSENIGNSGRGRSQGVPKIFRAPICRARSSLRQHSFLVFTVYIRQKMNTRNDKVSQAIYNGTDYRRRRRNEFTFSTRISKTLNHHPRTSISGVATGVYVGIYTPKISPSKLFMG